MPTTLPYASTHKPLRGRPLPQWAWLLAFLFFPIGPFLALAAAKLLTWRKAILLAILSYSAGAAATFLCVRVDGSAKYHSLVPLVEDLMPISIVMVWSFIIYRIGSAVDYWSPRTRRACIILFWIAFALVLVGILITLIRLLFPGLHA